MRISDWSSDVCSSDLISRLGFCRSGFSRELSPRILHLPKIISILGRLHLPPRHEPQRRRVDSIPQPAHLARAVIEHVPQLAVAVPRTHLAAVHPAIGRAHV